MYIFLYYSLKTILGSFEKTTINKVYMFWRNFTNLKDCFDEGMTLFCMFFLSFKAQTKICKKNRSAMGILEGFL